MCHRYTLSTLMHVMNQPAMTGALPDACLQHLISTLLLKLAEARVRLLEGGAALMQGMNVLMMRTLNHCDQYALFLSAAGA